MSPRCQAELMHGEETLAKARALRRARDIDALHVLGLGLALEILHESVEALSHEPRGA